MQEHEPNSFASPVELEPLLTIPEVCAILGNIHRATLAKLTRVGALPKVKIGGATRYRPSDVHAYIAANRVGVRK